MSTSEFCLSSHSENSPNFGLWQWSWDFIRQGDFMGRCWWMRVSNCGFESWKAPSVFGQTDFGTTYEERLRRHVHILVFIYYSGFSSESIQNKTLMLNILMSSIGTSMMFVFVWSDAYVLSRIVIFFIFLYQNEQVLSYQHRKLLVNITYIFLSVLYKKLSSKVFRMHFF